MSIALLFGLAPTRFASPAEAGRKVKNGLIVLPFGTPPITNATGGVADDLDLFAVGSDGAGLRRLTEGPAADYDPAWSPDGSKVAFARALPFALAGDIYVMNRDGSDLVNLTNSPLNDDFGADWSPDGRRIVFGSWTNTPTYLISEGSPVAELGADIFVMDSDGSNVTPLVNEPGDQGLPAWSPDGRWIAYADLSTGSIEMVSLDGSRRRTVIKPKRVGGGALQADWSPDGNWIVFTAGSQQNHDIWVARQNGSGLRNLTRSSGNDDRWAAWSPDGTQIVFVSNRDRSWRLYRMDSDGGNVKRLIDVELAGGYTSRPDWGPRP